MADNINNTGSTGKQVYRIGDCLPGIVLFLLSLVVGLLTFKTYGISWDEPVERALGLVNYEYIVNNSQELFSASTVNYGAGYALALAFLEKWLNLTDTRDIYLMRHLVTHLLFLVSLLAAYGLVLHLFKNKFLACLGFLMLLLAPRLYAHSFFNSKDIPFLSMMLISLAVAQLAFARNKPTLFLLLGLVCGYTTSIRIMGAMLFVFILLFLLIDLLTALKNKQKPNKPALNMGLFVAGFCFLLYVSWPYLWREPIHNFIDSFTKFAHYNDYRGNNFIKGAFVPASQISWDYFPTWFLITNPELWLLAGIGGLVWIIISMVRRPGTFLQNTNERNFLLYLLCFSVPIIMVIGLHSVIYDDWRHLYFIYPSFVLLGLYLINKLLQTKYQLIVMVICAVQVLVIGSTMFITHPFNQVYFNMLVSHNEEHLRNNYELEYWGTGFKQGLEYILKNDNSSSINISGNFSAPLANNIMMLPEKDRSRLHLTGINKADYFLTNYRDHPFDYAPFRQVYSATTQGSTILSVFALDKDKEKRKELLRQEIAVLQKALTIYPENGNWESTIGDLYVYTNQLDRAEEYFRKAHALSPKAQHPVQALAQLYFAGKKYQQFIDINGEAIVASPNNPLTYFNSAYCFMLLGRYDSAINYCNQALAVNPQFTDAYEIIASSYFAMGVADSAKKYEAVAKMSNPAFSAGAATGKAN